LPKLITFSTGNTIEFLYDAAGNKLRKTTKTGATVQYVQDYFPGGIEYRQTGTGVKRVESVYHAEGRYYNTNVDASNTIAWRKEYSFRDHLGNTRLAFSDRNANGIVDITGTASTSDILQENHYYPFGLAFEGPWLQNDAGVRDNQYMYNGKELHSDFGLGMYAYGARYYDPSIGRFIGVDPISDEFPFVSTFNYAENEPIANIDLHGLQKWKAVAGGFINATVSNNSLGLINRGDPARFGKDANAFAVGQFIGDVVSVITGAAEVGGGGGATVAGVITSPFTFGLTASVSVVGVAVATHGAAVTGTAAANIVRAMRNPNGSKGKPDHQEKVKELTDKAKSETKAGEQVLTERKIQGHDSKRIPDVQIVDKTGKTRKVFEAERRPNSARNKTREAEYDRLEVDRETHSLNNNQ
jgi:RHS repeat-associated protein